MTGEVAGMVSPGFFSPTSKIGRLRQACLDLAREHEADGTLPTNGRFLFYELEQRGVVPKAYPGKARKPSQDVSDALMDLRQAGLIPWEWIVDETREVAAWHSASTVYEYVMDAAASARIDCWDGRPAPLIICEARSTKGVLERIAAAYLAPITATNGQAGGFLVTDIVPLLQENTRPVLYIGDHEVGGPGDQIEDNTRRYIEAHADRRTDWTRIALTQAQVDADPRLLSLVIEKTDNRSRPPQRYQAVECEAVGQLTLETLLRDTLDRLLPAPLDAVLERQDTERLAVLELLRTSPRR